MMSSDADKMWAEMTGKKAGGPAKSDTRTPSRAPEADNDDSAPEADSPAPVATKKSGFPSATIIAIVIVIAIVILSAVAMHFISRGVKSVVKSVVTPDLQKPGVVLPQTPPTPAATSLLNLNTATKAQLEAVPGIGPATAQAIIDHRTRVGKFASVDDLTSIPGIGKKTLEKLRLYFTAQ